MLFTGKSRKGATNTLVTTLNAVGLDLSYPIFADGAKIKLRQYFTTTLALKVLKQQVLLDGDKSSNNQFCMVADKGHAFYFQHFRIRPFPIMIVF